MENKRITYIILLAVIIAGCSQSPPEAVNYVGAEGTEAEEESPQSILSLSDNWSVMRDAKLHYAQALIYEDTGDTVRMLEEFESSMNLLSEIDLTAEESEAFKGEYEATYNKVSKDYQLSIRRIRLLGRETSAATLMEKLELFEAFTDTSGMAVKILQEYANTIQKEIPLQVNYKVHRIIRFFQSEGRKPFELWLQRSGKYRELLESILEEEGAPKDLFYLAMVESGLSPTAYSWARASGMWQFIAGTGKLYGLKRDWWIDERRNPVKSTYAAARYLKDLHKRFGDWYLAMAAYNSGEGRVDRAMRREKTRNYWELATLPSQTKNYVPSFVAAMLIGENPAAFGFEVELMSPLEYDEVAVEGSIELGLLAEAAGVTEKEISALNPELRRRAIPAIKGGYTLRIPPGIKEDFLKKVAKIPKSEKTVFVQHRVKRGETLSTIAEKYGIGLSQLINANSIRNRNRIRAGTTILIPSTYASSKGSSSPGTPLKKRRVAAAVPAPGGTKRIVYKVRRGDTLGHIAEYFGTTAGKLRVWNGLRYGHVIFAGQKISVYVPDNLDVKAPKIGVADRRMTKTMHRVDKGENLTRIAEKFDVGVGNIKLWNSLRGDGISAGDKLVIWTAKPDLAAATGNGYKVHMVKRGDTLWEISRSYGVPVSELVSWNPWTSSKTLRPGDRLKIYAQ